MSGNVGIASPQDIQEIFKSIDTAWTAIDWKVNPFCEKISYYSTASKGKTKVVPLVNSMSSPMYLPLGADRQFSGVEVFKVEVEHKTLIPLQSMEVFQEQLLSDVYDVVMLDRIANGVVAGARQAFSIELAKTMIANAVGFDGVSHINTAHPVNQLRPALGTYSNDAGAVDIDEAGVGAALDLLIRAPDFSGQPDAARVRKVYVVLPTFPLYLKAAKIFGIPIAGAGLIAAPGTAAGTSVAVNSPFTFSFAGTEYQFELVLEPLLSMLPGGSSKNWFLVNGSAIVKPYVTSIVQMPRLALEGMDQNEHLRVQKLAYRATWDAFGGCGNGHPREVVRGTAP